jgi:hypothetical protein
VVCASLDGRKIGVGGEKGYGIARRLLKRSRCCGAVGGGEGSAWGRLVEEGKGGRQV